MSNRFGHIFNISIFGESHGPGIGVVIDGLPPGIKIEYDYINTELKRRRPGKSKLATSRDEADEFEFLSGIKNGYTSGASICAIIRNTDSHSKDYGNIINHPRPSHSDYPASIKYNNYNDINGGGQFSGRLTAPVVLAGAIAKSILNDYKIKILERIKSVYQYEDIKLDYSKISLSDFTFSDPDFPVLDDKAEKNMKEAILHAKDTKDSLGGIVECFSFGLPVGLGEPLYDNLDSRIAGAILNIPSVKAIEFGRGFDSTKLKGSQNNDHYYYDKGVKTRTNNHGGILAGMATGMPLVFSAAIKPTASIGIGQETINLQTHESYELTIDGRHDPCIVPRALVVIEAWTSLVLLDMMILGGYYGNL